MSADLKRPYLVIPKLVEQPTWGGDYIVNFKSWAREKKFQQIKIGQAYELFHGSNLSLLNSSAESEFTGELCLTGMVSEMTTPAHSLSLAQLISEKPEAILGNAVVNAYGKWMPLLIKFTQALGNSFQIHIKDDPSSGQMAPTTKWKPKPESWYYFEPGIATVGVKPGINWAEYEKTVTELEAKITALGEQIKLNKLFYRAAREKIVRLIELYNPQQFVNRVEIKKDDLLDLSGGGIHHSWEEDETRFHWGNVLYELQLNVFDEDSTIRAFDKGKISPEGNVRPLHIVDYFKYIDRTTQANNPSTYMIVTKPLKVSKSYEHHRLLESKYYTLEKVILKTPAWFTEKIDHFRHIFVKSGSIEVFTSHTSINVTTGHSCFIPAGAFEYGIKNVTPESTILISY